MHPAARWIGRELSLEREVACDDWWYRRLLRSRLRGCLARVAEAGASRSPRCDSARCCTYARRCQTRRPAAERQRLSRVSCRGLRARWACAPLWREPRTWRQFRSSPSSGRARPHSVAAESPGYIHYCQRLNSRPGRRNRSRRGELESCAGGTAQARRRRALALVSECRCGAIKTPRGVGQISSPRGSAAARRVADDRRLEAVPT